MSFSFVLPDSGLSFKQSYVHPVSPIKMGRNTLVLPRRVQVYIQRETSQTLERKTSAHPHRLRAGRTRSAVCLAETLSSTEMKEQREEIWWNSWGGEGSRFGRATRKSTFLLKSCGLLETDKQSCRSSMKRERWDRKSIGWCWCRGKPGIREGTWSLPSHLGVAAGSTHLGKGGESQEHPRRETGPRDPVQDTERLWASLPSSGK